MSDKRALVVQAGEHHRQDCPVWIEAPSELPSDSVALSGHKPDVRISLQRIGNHLVFILKDLARGDSRDYQLEAGQPSGAGVAVTEREGALEIRLGDRPFTTYRYGANEVRPYFYPLLGPTDVPMTRNYPMADVSGESTDHPHHRSLYVAFGEVNGVDVWAEPPHPNTGRIVHQSWESIEAGAAAARLIESLQWVDGAGNPLLDERRTIIVYNTVEARLIDLEIVLSPNRAAVLFGDTKEGGPLAIRVASPMEGKRGGLIENAYGGRREAETWGKQSPWVDYSGVVNGDHVGVAIMDHPTSFRHPTTWHVRDYGLFAANPFGLSAFTNDPSQRGEFVLLRNHELTFRYRVCLHPGDAEIGRVGERYHDFANPPSTIWAE